ncbi:NmrA domain-containing protein [Mycena indigotica]|uniref:NmrA domain-containing protein n=1 Tax=Mycena indigotica TaxID=2126181 RepID=A0A8H6SEW3_9AGAR|nr:NmrA domain-containing protein [Mycena indigotica]KAF7297446.1 NmrA domain-containing protein [Mycena indigotica]
MPRKTILVAGATGHQGSAVVRSLLSSPDATDFRILLLTRTAQSATAVRLVTAFSSVTSDVCLVQADMSDIDALRRVFVDEQRHGAGVWGVFSVVAYPGLGVSGDGAEKQGKNLADVALEFNVSTFIYSSAERAGEYYDDNMKLDGIAKVNIERHVKELGKKGLRWTLLRPGFFMENYEGFIGSLIVSVFKAGLQPTTTVPLVAVEDIGAVAAAVFRNPVKYQNQILAIIGEVSTMSEQDAAHKSVAGTTLPALHWSIAKATLALNKDTQELIQHLERLHMARQTGLCPEVADQVAMACEAHPGMRSLKMWVAEKKAGGTLMGEAQEVVEPKEGWNEISILKLLTGRS